MTRTSCYALASLLFFPQLQAQNQSKEPESGNAPIYRITVVRRTVKAIDYKYRSATPIHVDFRGTELMPKARGAAWVEAQRGRTEIDTKFEKVEIPQRFGREYLTYVLWALTPDGRPHNLGEVVTNPSNKADMKVTTDLPVFAMIVTAEPYAAVRTPSDVVILENEIPSGKVAVEPVDAKYELLPRGTYAWNPGETTTNKLPKVSMNQYEALSELYQARNAVGIARSNGADRYAPDMIARAQQLLDDAQHLQDRKAKSKIVVQNAREAMHIAEDARTVAFQREQKEGLIEAKVEATEAKEAQSKAEANAAAEVAAARAEADSSKAQAEIERANRQRAEADAAGARQRAEEAQARAAEAEAAVKPSDTQIVVRVPSRQSVQEERTALRKQLFDQLNTAMMTLDSSRGLVALVPDREINDTRLLGRISAVLASQPTLRVRVEGYCDSSGTDAATLQHAKTVRDLLVSQGLDSSRVSFQGFGKTRPMASNSTASGREQNRRVEIVITGEAIGDQPVWDHPLSISRR